MISTETKTNSVYARSYGVESQLLVSGSNILSEVAQNRLVLLINQERSNPSGLSRIIPGFSWVDPDYFLEKQTLLEWQY